MKRALFVLGVLFLVGCAFGEEMPEENEPAAVEPGIEAVDSEAAEPELARCSSAGGTCRKSRCRAGEVSNWDLECGTDAQCCVPVQEAQIPTCSSAGGTCRKSACRVGEVLSRRYLCGTDAACCVPAP
jgi:hypothetical protein